MILERRVYEQKNPVLYTGTEYTFYRTPNGFQVYKKVNRGNGFENEYKEYYSELPEDLQRKWEQGVSY